VDKRCIRVGYSLFVGDKTSTITSAYVEMLRRFYTAKDLSKNPESGGRLLPDSEIPSFRQFDYWGKQYFDEVETERGRKGMRKWLKDCRPFLEPCVTGFVAPAISLRSMPPLLTFIS
jgi:hypothetical protein